MGSFIDTALKSIASQSYSHWELLAVDDCGPDDGTERTVQEFADTYSERRIEWIRHDQNRGVSAARNTAMHLAKGEFIAFLDPDDFWVPDYLANSIQVFTGRSDIDVVTSMVRVIGDSEGAEQIYGATKIDRRLFPSSLAIRNFIQPSATVLRRKLLTNADGFDTTPEIQHVEDWDLWIRLASQGCQFHFRDDADCTYRKHPGGATSNRPAMQIRVRYLMGKHITFFTEHNAAILQQLAEQTSELESKLASQLTSMSHLPTGPLMRTIALTDRVICRMARLFRKP